MKRLAVILALLASVLGGTAAIAPAPAAHASSLTLGDRVLNRAETQAGCWYRYGAAGPCGNGFDCSGLVFASARALGIYLPRTTYGMLSGSWHLYRVWSPRRGDLAFFGTGHVEIVTGWYHTTFGAHHTGERVSWRKWSAYYHPTIYLRLR